MEKKSFKIYSSVEGNENYYCGKDIGTLIRMPFSERIALTEKMEFIECGAISMEESEKLVEAACRGNARMISIISPLFWGVNENELLEYYSILSSRISSDVVMLIRSNKKYSNNDISRVMVERIISCCPAVKGLIDDTQDAKRMMELATDRNYILFSENSSVAKISEYLGYDGVIV